MNFLKKILLIVVISLSAESMGAVFDLPTGTPGLQNGGATSVHPHNGIQCIKVTVNGHDIYFPADGSQPTTPDAVNYSLANIDNRENSPITYWYMIMFGVIPINHAEIAAGGAGAPAPIYVQAGWDNAGPNVQRIISFDITCNGVGHNSCTAVDDTHIVNDPNIPGETISRRALFEREFRKIASTSVGRVLLYRILIEIRRHQAGNNVGCAENSTFVGTELGTLVTDRCRNVNIAYDYGLYGVGFGFSDTVREILFVENPNNVFGVPIPFSVIGKSTREGYTHITQAPTTIDVSIFHEMLHWFHHLRNPKRNYEEINENNALHFNSTSIPQYYWHDIDCCILAWNASRENNYAPIWSSVDSRSHLDFEEMRTILGMPHNSNLNGDDLSENLYRMCKGSPLRFGYSGENFYEDRKVVDRVINVCLKNYIVYVTGKDSTVDFAYQIGSRQLFGKGRRK